MSHCFSKGTVMHKVCLFLELSVTLVMSAMAEHTQEHQMMVPQADHVLKGHSVLQVLLNLIPALPGRTVRVLVEQVIRIASLVILVTTVQGSS